MNVDFFSQLISLFLIGLLSGVHCVGMCGGIVGALSLQRQAVSDPRHMASAERTTLATAPAQTILWQRAHSQPRGLALWQFNLAYNLGRMSSYTLMGVLFASLGRLTVIAAWFLPLQQTFSLLANLLLIAIGLYLLQWWHGILMLEKIGAKVWPYLQPYTQRLLPLNTWSRAWLAGALWGWLPCGLVYSVIFTALASANPFQGGAMLLAFGLGTLPNLLLLGSALGGGFKLTQANSSRLGKTATTILTRIDWRKYGRKYCRYLGGGLILLFGGLGLFKIHPFAHIPGLAALCG